MTTVTRNERLDEVVRHLASMIASQPEAGGLASGDKAALRHFTGESPPPAFWRLASGKPLAGLIAELARGGDGTELELAFATLMQAMALLGPLAFVREPAELGEALARSGYSEPRFVRLLRARGPALAREIGTAARWCAQKGQAVAWPGAARLILAAFAPGRPFDPEREGHRQARFYYAAIARTEHA